MHLKNTAILASWIDLNKVAKPLGVCSQPRCFPYGFAVNVHDSEAFSSKCTSQSKPVVSIKDRTLNTKDFIASFAVKNSLPLPKISKLVEFTKFLAKDINALQHFKMNDTAATQKLTDSLSFHNDLELIDEMNKYQFSINMDQCTSNSNKRMFSILVSYFDELKIYL